MKQYYKVARPNGYDFHTGKTINYRDNIGKTVKPKSKSKNFEICTDSVLHASENFFDALSYGKIPCSIFIVEGNPVVEESYKCGFSKLKIIKESPTTHFTEAYQDWTIWMLQDITQYVEPQYTQQLTAINNIRKLYIESKTRTVSKQEWNDAARYAAYTAYAAYAAYAADAARYAADAADAAYAAYAARYAARYAADAARYAADAADAAYAAYTADAATWKTFADSLELFGCKQIAELVIKDFDSLGIKNNKDLDKFVQHKQNEYVSIQSILGEQ
ncbi:MAG: hypothetical protein HZC29_01730 [Thaumarchaeota archaeon]|nr:hypothetical protein [Nitrososphaerota archaeon]